MDLCKAFGRIKLFHQHTRNSKGNFQCHKLPAASPHTCGLCAWGAQPAPANAISTETAVGVYKNQKGGGKAGKKKKKKKERGSFSFSISFPSCGTTDEPVLINPSLSAAGRHRAASLVCQHRCSPRARNKPNQGNGPWQPGTTSGQQPAAQGGPLTQTSNLTEIIFSADPHEA